MAVPLDASTIATDALYFSLVFIFTNIIRIFFRPFSIESKIIAQFLARLTITLINSMKRWTGEDSHPHLEAIKREMYTLRKRLKPSKIKVG